MVYVTNKNIGLTGGGDSVIAMEIMDSLRSMGLDVATISMRYQMTETLKEKNKRVKNFVFPFIPDKESYSGQAFGAVRYGLKKIECNFKLLKLQCQFTKKPPKLIISNDKITGRYFSNKDVRGNAKTVMVVHSIPDFYEVHKGESLDEYFEIFEKTDFIVFVSEECRKKWLSYHKIDENKTSYIHNCANENFAKKSLTESKDTVRKRLKMSPDKFYLISVASFNYEKGLDLLLEAAPKLKNIAPNLEILLIGSDTAKYFESFKKQANNEVGDYLKILGFKNNAMEYIYASDAFILPSRVEAFPLVILESMIMKTPVIASRVGGIPEMIAHGETGLLFEKNDVAELIRCFDKMYKNYAEAIVFAEKASRKYWNTFSKKKFTKHYLELVEGIKDN